MPLPSELLETTGVTLLIDSLRYSALPLSKYFVHKWLDRYDAATTSSSSLNTNTTGKVIILLLETKDLFLLLGDEAKRLGLLGVVDCVTNPIGWDCVKESPQQKMVLCSNYADSSSIVQAIKKLIDSEQDYSANISVAIDSLVPFIIKNGIDAATSLVNRIMQIKSTSTPTGDQTTHPIRRIVATIHEDVIFDTIALDRFAYISSVVMRTGPPALELLPTGVVSTSSKADGELQILQKRESSKVIRLSEEYALDSKTETLTFLPRSNRRSRGTTGKRSTSSSTSSSSSTPPGAVSSLAAEIASLKSVTTTFNLGITEEQKKVKEGVELPYVHKNKTTTLPSSSSSGGGVIYLDPDDIEYESDDPDDDLDI